MVLMDYKRLQKSDMDYKSLLIPLITVIDIYLLGPLLTKGHPKSACAIHPIQGRYLMGKGLAQGANSFRRQV
jgi:hypothetical protein